MNIGRQLIGWFVMVAVSMLSWHILRYVEDARNDNIPGRKYSYDCQRAEHDKHYRIPDWAVSMCKEGAPFRKTVP